MTERYLKPYADYAGRHGTDVGVTLWANERSQQLRFSVMAQMIFLGGKRILDAGCSRGDFAAFLVENDIDYARFVGVDGIREVIDFASQRSLPRAEFVVADLVTQPDIYRTGQPQIICLSGTLNTMSDNQVQTVLDSAWDAADEAFIFNFLSSRHGRGVRNRQDPARRLDTMKLLDWAMTQTPNVAFRQDYFAQGHDATILMRKD